MNKEGRRNEWIKQRTKVVDIVESYKPEVEFCKIKQTNNTLETIEKKRPIMRMCECQDLNGSEL